MKARSLFLLFVPLFVQDVFKIYWTKQYFIVARNNQWILLLFILCVWQLGVAQMPSWQGKNGVQVVTCRADNDNDYVIGLMDTRNVTTAPLSLDWMPTMYHDPSWIRSNLGQVFGIAIDQNDNIYVTASSSYGMPNAYNSSTLTGVYGTGGSGAVYKIDATTGSISTFVVIPQDQTVLVVDDTGPNVQLEDKDGNRVGAGLGNICYDRDHNQFFVTSFDDGKIYRISSSGTILNSFDPQTCPGCIADPSPTDSGDDVISPLGDRPWGIGYYAGKLYFSIWTEDRRTDDPSPESNTFNQIFSISLDPSGDFSGTETLEVTMPGFKKDGASSAGIYSNPISDIEFDIDGNMAVAERGMISDVDASAHRSGVFYLERSGTGTYTSPVDYPVSPPYIRIGTAPSNDNGSASGGVDFTYDGYNATTMEAEGDLNYVWATGHRLREPGDDGGPGGSSYILSGSQMSPVSGWTPNGEFWQYSYFVDFDGVLDNANKTAQGDVDVFRSNACTLSVSCTATPQTNCTPPNGGASVTVSGGQGNITYAWSSGETVSSITGKMAGTYTVTVTDDFLPGCSTTCQAVIANATVNPTCSITANNQPSCANLTGGSITVNPSPAGTYTYNWSDIGAGPGTRTGLSGGTYTVTVTNSTTGCTGVCDITLTTPTNCCNISAIVPQNVVCLDNNTPNNHTDNRIRFSALVTNTNASLLTYNVTINGGTTITPNTNVGYGTTQFTLGPGTAGGGATFTITVEDSATPGCTQTFMVTDPGGCPPANECPTPQCGTATIQVNGN